MTAKRARRGTKGTRRPLAEMKRRFVEAFMANGGNATAAAKTAGYSAKTARQQGSRLLTLVDVRHALEDRVKACPIALAKEERQQFWSVVMRGDGPHVLVPMRDRLKASELLGRSSGDFIEHHKHDVEGSLASLLAEHAEKTE